MYKMTDGIEIERNWEDKNFEKLQHYFIRLSNIINIHGPTFSKLIEKVEALNKRYYDRIQNLP